MSARVAKPRGPHNKRNGVGESSMLPNAPAPCVGCKNAQRCIAEKLGCDALAVFQSVGASAARLAYAPRQPSAAIYERIQDYTKRRKTAPPPYRRPAVDDEGEDG